MNSYQLDVCEQHIAFRTEASAERVEQARAYVEKLYQEMAGNLLGRERIMAILLIGIADEMLQLRCEGEAFASRVGAMLEEAGIRPAGEAKDAG